ncbi:MAG: DNA polymerase I [Armatimonadetes bacterium]|nr:DNA polymerase I [Armatimonadota bacterium]
MSPSNKKLIAIDGNSLLYRAFFAMRYLSTSSGQPTNAVYGLTTMLLRLLEEKPDYIAAAFDTPKPTFRHEEYDKYKAHRKPTPDALIEQGPVARELIEAFGIPVVEVPGYEADDIIGAMAKEAEAKGIDTVVVTGDLDTLQLIDDHVSVMTTIKGVSDTVMYDAGAVRARFGLEPEQMVDYKGLKGDPSDNIPGVPGIGDKTAVDLLKQFGTVENLLEHLSELPEGKMKKTLEENADIARLSKKLATIVTALPVKIDPEDYIAKQPDYDVLRDLFVRLEFKTMLKRLPEVEKAVGKAGVEVRATLGQCRRIGTDDELRELISSIGQAGEFALQCHTANGKSIEAEIIGISFCTGPDNTAYVQVIDPTKQGESSLELGFDCPYEADLSHFKTLLGSDKMLKYCHDSKLNTAALALRGVQLTGVAFDTMLAAYLLDSTRSSYEIGDVAFEQLSLELPGVTTKKGDSEVDPETVVCGEAEAIYRLKPVMEEKLRRDGLYHLLSDLELPLAAILAEMELTGVAIDFEQLGALSTTLAVEVRQVEQKIYEQAGEEFNIGSPKQLQAVLFDKLGLAASKKTKTGFSTSAGALEELAAEYPIVADILRYRELTKIKSTYSDSLPKLVNQRTHRVHTSLNQAVAATGRLSSSNPNLQNIPIRTELGRKIRKAFIASGDNVLLSADYSQIELRILAHMTEDAALVRAFENDEDIHRATACTMFNCVPEDVTPEMRRRAKTINFAVIYGMADYTLSRALGISVKEAREYIDTYFAKFPGVLRYTEETIDKARNQGYVETLMGRRRYIPDIKSANRNIRLFAERAAVNMPIQGTAADIMKLAMLHVHKALVADNLASKMVLQVHDELLLEVVPDEIKQAADHLRRGMESAYEMKVPLKVDVKVGKNWAEMV